MTVAGFQREREGAAEWVGRVKQPIHSVGPVTLPRDRWLLHAGVQVEVVRRPW